MIGVIEKVLVDCLLDAGGEPLRCKVFDVAGISRERVYRLDRHYPDDETGRLLTAALEVTGLSETALYELFSRTFLDVVAEVFPEFLKMAKTSEDLVHMQAKIHALIAAGIRSPQGKSETNDKFRLHEIGPHEIEVTYRSELQLCNLYCKLVQEAARRYGDEVELTRATCRKKGAASCGIRVHWTLLGGQPTTHHGADLARFAADAQERRSV